MRTESTAAAKIRAASYKDMTACGQILNDWIDETPWMPRLHSHDDVIRHHRDFVFTNRTVTVVEGPQASVQGFAATSSDGFITGFYLARHARRKGLGKMILNHIKDRSPGGLNLWTFVANSGARTFYEREKFKEIRRTEGENEENLPDILFAWQAKDEVA